MDRVVLDEESLERIKNVQALILGYLQERGYDEERIHTIFSEEIKSGLPASQKLILQQMIRERSKQDGRDLDELIREEKATRGELENTRGQILGVFSKIEGAYLEVLLQEAVDKKVIVKH